MKKLIALGFAAILIAAPAFAHVVVAPQQATAGASQVYKVRVHNDGKVPTASIALQIPDGVTVERVDPVSTGRFETTQAGDRITVITWSIEVPTNKYVELAFTAKNPAAGARVNWNVTETFKDGSKVEFSDKPGAAEKSSVTRIVAATAAK